MNLANGVTRISRPVDVRWKESVFWADFALVGASLAALGECCANSMWATVSLSVAVGRMEAVRAADFDRDTRGPHGRNARHAVPTRQELDSRSL